MAFLDMCSANGPTHIAIFKLFVRSFGVGLFWNRDA